MRARLVGGGTEAFGTGSKDLVEDGNAPCPRLYFAIAHQLARDLESMSVGGFLVGKFNALPIGDAVPAGSQKEIEQRHRPSLLLIRRLKTCGFKRNGDYSAASRSSSRVAISSTRAIDFLITSSSRWNSLARVAQDAAKPG